MPQAPALYCVLHNDTVFLHEDKSPCSHIFSAVVQRSPVGLDLSLQDYNGKSHSIHTYDYRAKFNMAAFVPIPAAHAQRLIEVVDQINMMGEYNAWPFYFARTMESRSDIGIDSETGLTREKINCVSMSMLAARAAGINVDGIAGIGKLSIGEDVRDRIDAQWQQYSTQAGIPVTPAKQGTQAQIVTGQDGITIAKYKADINVGMLLDKLAEEEEGQTLFDRLTGTICSTSFIGASSVPAHVQAAVSVLQKKSRFARPEAFLGEPTHA